MQLVKAVIHQARRCETDPAVAFGGGIVDFRGLIGQTGAAIEAIRLLGLPSGALVLLDIRNPIHHLATIYALALLGLKSASVGASFTAQAAGGPRPAVFLTDRDDLNGTDIPLQRVDSRWFAFDAARPIDYAKLLAMPGFPDPDDVFRYVYSSGTTGRPKCVALTNRAMEARIGHLMLSLSRRSSAGAEINLMGFSTTLGIMAPLFTHTVGALLCFPSSPAETLHMTRLFNVTSINGAVVQIKALVDALGSSPPPAGLRSVGVAAARVPPALLKDIRARLCSHVISAYGSTELGALSFGTAADLERGDGATGHVLPWVKLEVVDDDRNPLPPGADGIIRAQTDELAFYVDAEGNAAEMLEDGWFYPGDYGRIEPDGLVVITGRIGDIINRGGVVVAPDYVEEVLKQAPGVADVAVVGAPGDDGLDKIWAAIIAPEEIDGEAVMAFARARLNERSPDRLFQVERFPRAESGKLQRNALRQQLQEMLAAGTSGG
ncbi:class I adenylate-forming enzyme family protein [Devosia sp.]|uniref:class I adenylate-forming enzyme family protein n=1 Tax=Devosia sp. TaxID=1871048 RepID=UPI003A93676E